MPRPRGRKRTGEYRQCAVCGETFYVKRCELKYSPRLYCSVACYSSMKTGPRPRPLSERFWRYVKKTDGGCWEWTGCKCSGGYGHIQDQYPADRMVKAHRASYELHKGPIPEGLDVLHACDNKWCVNPEHLAVGTHQENIMDAARKGLLPAKLTPDMVRAIRNRSNGVSLREWECCWV